MVLKEITHFCLSLVFYVTITYCRLGHYYVTFNLCIINFGNRLKSKAVVINKTSCLGGENILLEKSFANMMGFE